MTMKFCRYLNIRNFICEVDALQAFRDGVGGLLESFEQSRLLVPHTRIRYPDPIAWRLWMERHDGIAPKDIIEPEGERWHAAIDLEKALHRWSEPRFYGPLIHPLDEPDVRFAEFLQRPEQVPFQAWSEMRVDVSGDLYPQLLAGC